jgi:heat-inducible transcriptional repressor
MTVFVTGDREVRILSHIIHIYLETHLPVASHRIAQMMGMSPATIRSVMADLEEKGFLESAHCSAGRIPTIKTLRFYAQNLAGQEESLPLSEGDFSVLDAMEHSDSVLGKVSQTLSDLCQGAGVFFSAPQDPIIASLKFTSLGPGKCLCTLEDSSGKTDYRIVSIPLETNDEQLNEASNFLNHLIARHTAQHALAHVEKILNTKKDCLHVLILHLMQKGVCEDLGALDIKGHGYLLDSIQDAHSMIQFKMLFAWLEKQKMFCDMLHNVILKRRLQIFFGSDDGFANVYGCSVVVAPYQAEHNKGVVGVIGPMHMDYRRVIPIIDGMAKIVERTFK